MPLAQKAQPRTRPSSSAYERTVESRSVGKISCTSVGVSKVKGRGFDGTSGPGLLLGETSIRLCELVNSQPLKRSQISRAWVGRPVRSAKSTADRYTGAISSFQFNRS